MRVIPEHSVARTLDAACSYALTRPDIAKTAALEVVLATFGCAGWERYFDAAEALLRVLRSFE